MPTAVSTSSFGAHNLGLHKSFGSVKPTAVAPLKYQNRRLFSTIRGSLGQDEDKPLPFDPALHRLSFSSDLQPKIAEFVQTLNLNPYLRSAAVGRKMATLFATHLPPETVHLLKQMGHVGEPDIVHIKNFPIDTDIPSGKTAQERCAKKGYVSEYAMLGIVKLMGYRFYTLPTQQNGSVINNVSPVKGAYDTFSSKGRVPFFLHTDGAHQAHPPSFLMLVGLEGDRTSQTSYLHIGKLLEGLPQWVEEGMKKPHFRIRSGDGFDGREEGAFALISQDLRFRDKRMRLRIRQNMERVVPMTEEAGRVLAYFEARFAHLEAEGKHIHAVSLQRGDALIFNNGWGIDHIKGVMHGRSGYVSNLNRWLQRGLFHPPEHEVHLTI